jgi:hypothetical protein
MKDPIKATKQAYKNLLTNAVSYNGSIIPVYIGESSKADSNYYIIIGNISDEINPNKHIFSSNVTVNIELYAKVPNISTDHFAQVDVMAEQVLELVIPSISTTGLDYGSVFEVKAVQRRSSEQQTVEITEAGRLVTRTITFIQTINQL